jgi:hypothetical protein
VRNRGVAKETLVKDGMALQWASEEMRGDRELCMAAVTQDGKALQWAGQEMKSDRELRVWSKCAVGALSLRFVPVGMVQNSVRQAAEIYDAGRPVH